MIIRKKAIHSGGSFAYPRLSHLTFHLLFLKICFSFASLINTSVNFLYTLL